MSLCRLEGSLCWLVRGLCWKPLGARPVEEGEHLVLVLEDRDLAGVHDFGVACDTALGQGVSHETKQDGNVHAAHLPG